MNETSAELDDGDGVDAAAAGRRRTGRGWLRVALLLVLALVLSAGIKTFVAQAFYIPSPSMEPGLVKNDRILVQKVSYWFGGSPRRGDVVVFEDPGGWLSATESESPSWWAGALSRVGLRPAGGHLVKRVIGLPGDTLRCCDATTGRLQVNGVSLDESSFIRHQQPPPRGCDGPMVPSCDWEVTVPPGRLFVMGDNRADSGDSSARLCPYGSGGVRGCDRAFVPLDLVVGKVSALWWPLGRAHLVGRPEVFDDVPDPD